jgi:membrane-bound serine protease (ClpP class)
VAVLLGCVALLVGHSPAGGVRPVVVVGELEGAVTPVASQFIADLIDRGEEEDAACIVLELDTPGGLYKSTHVICKAILASRVPFVTYIAPAGSRATSAGVFITYAAHIAAMHPASSLGAAHPVNLAGGQADTTMMKKAENDAVAFIRSLAERHERNADWAESAVRESVSITADEALGLEVADLVVEDLESLLNAIDGLEIELESGQVTIQSADARVERIEMSWRFRLLDYVSDPNIAYVLFTLGTLGLLLELYNPGSLLPGVAGSICLILAFYGLHTLPLNLAGLLLILVAIVLFILEVKVTSYGVLTIGGVIAMLLGSLMLIDIDPSIDASFLRIKLEVIITVVAVTVLFFTFVVTKGILAQRSKAHTGLVGLVGERGTARTDIRPGHPGKAQVHGEIWVAESDEPISAGEQIRVLSGERLRLRVGREPV